MIFVILTKVSISSNILLINDLISTEAVMKLARLKSNKAFQIFNNTSAVSAGICKYHYTVVQLLLKKKMYFKSKVYNGNCICLQKLYM